MAPLACIKKLFDEKKRRDTATSTATPSSSSSGPPPPPPPSVPRRHAPISFAVLSGLGTLGLVPASSNPSALPVPAPPTTNSAPAPPTSSAATVIPGMKALWAQQRAAAKAATTSSPQPTPTSTSISASSPPSAPPPTTPFCLASAWTSNTVADEDDPMEWDEMDCSDDYPFLGQVGSNQAAWVYERVILPSMIDAGLPLLPSPPYAFPFVTEPTTATTYSSSIFPTSYRTIGASTL